MMTPEQTLTPREREVIGYVADGLRNPEIARRMGITHNYVRQMMLHIFDKVGVDTRLELAKWSLKQGHRLRSRCVFCFTVNLEKR